MTLIVSWIGVDDKKEGKEIASIYISSDSRYTWGNTGKFDYGVKVFGSTKFPEIFGFCGDVLFPSTILGQIIPQIDNGILFTNSDNAEIKSNKIFSYIKSSFKSYPKTFINDSFTILHGTRFEKSFKLYKIFLNPDKKLQKEEIYLGNISTKVFSGGSGASEFNKNWLQWTKDKHNDYRSISKVEYQRGADLVAVFALVPVHSRTDQRPNCYLWPVFEVQPKPEHIPCGSGSH